MSFRGAVQMPALEDLLIGHMGGNPSSLSANFIFLSPIVLPRSMTIVSIRLSIATSGGNMGIAIYDRGLTRLFTTGSIPVPAAGKQTVSLTALGAAWSLRAGFYYLGIVNDTGTASFTGVFNPAVAGDASGWGLNKGASFPPPASISGPGLSNTMPIIGLSELP